MANIEQPEEALERDARSAPPVSACSAREFLFLNKSRLPGEDEQYEAYAAAVTAMQGRPVTIRTIDVGADKTPDGPGVHRRRRASALGQRAIRYSLAEPDIFLTQLRALLRASIHGPLRILLPMLSHSAGDRRLADPDRPGPRAVAPARGEVRRPRAGRRHDRGAGGGAVGRLVRAAP